MSRSGTTGVRDTTVKVARENEKSPGRGHDRGFSIVRHFVPEEHVLKLRAVANEAGERGGVCPPVLRQIHRGLTPLRSPKSLLDGRARYIAAPFLCGCEGKTAGQNFAHGCKRRTRMTPREVEWKLAYESGPALYESLHSKRELTLTLCKGLKPPRQARRGL